MAYSAIKNGIPYSNDGDLISRSDLKQEFARITYEKFKADMGQEDYAYFTEKTIEEIIDNATAAETVTLEHHKKILGILQREIDSLVEIYDREDAKQAIKAVKPKRTWVYTSYSNGFGNYHCPECGKICPEMFNLREPYPFCPYCGEDLRGDDEE